MRTLLMIRGCPGTGKNTVARHVCEATGWKFFWLHHLDCVYEVIGDYRLPLLQDELCNTVLKELCRRGDNIVFVRPSRSAKTVEHVKKIAERFGYRFVLVTLKASYNTLLERVKLRNPHPYRIYDRRGLDEYLDTRPEEEVPQEVVIHTDYMSPLEVAGQITRLVQNAACKV